MVDYVRAHRKVARVRGKADTHACIDCGDQAQEWSFNYENPSPLFAGERRTPYSHDPSDYDPRCKKCHLKFDREMDPTLEERIAERTKNAVSGMVAASKEPEMAARLSTSRSEFASMKSRRCIPCGKESSPGGIGIHQKSSGHEGWETIR